MDAARLEEKYNRELEEMTDHLQVGPRAGGAELSRFQRLLGERTRESVAATDAFVRSNPYTALGIAAVLGCLCGYLASRR